MELSSVHKYAAGALFAIALNQAQLQCSFRPQRPEDEESEQGNASEVPWSSSQNGLAQHVFRYLGIEQKSWMGLECTASSGDARHHIGAFIRILSEEDKEPSTSKSLSEDDLAKAIDAMTVKVEESSSSAGTESKSGGDPISTDAQVTSNGGVDETRKTGEPSSDSAVNREKTRQSEQHVDSTVLARQRKMAILYELLVACVADAAEEKARATAGYDARYRATLRLLAAWLDVPWTKMAAMELMVAYMAMTARKEEESQNEDAKKSTWAKWKRGSLIGAAAVTGGTLLAITGGLAAPAIAAGLAALAPAAGTMMPVIGASGFAAAAAATGSAAGSIAVAASFGAAGAGLSGVKMARRTGGVDEFALEAIGDNHNQGRLAVGIVVSGIAFEPDDFITPWKFPDGDLEMFALRWETEIVMAVSTAIQDWLTTAVARELMKQGAMMTVLSGLLTALAWPTALLSVTDFIDSKWAIAVDRSDKAGELLANCLLKGLQGNRPVTLMGFSLGARVVFSCLEYLAASNSAGIVERVVLLGAPLAVDKQRWLKARQVVAGRFINCFSTNDWILGIVYRASIMSQGLAGLQAVEIPGVENLNVTSLINGHSSYLSSIPVVLEILDMDGCFPVLF